MPLARVTLMLAPLAGLVKVGGVGIVYGTTESCRRPLLRLQLKCTRQEKDKFQRRIA